MKKILLFLAAAFSMNAQADQPKFIDVNVAEITSVKNVQGSGLPGYKGYGSIVVDFNTNQVELNYLVSPECNPFLACPAVLLNKSIKVNIVQVVKGDCGTVTYIAKEDKRPVDGNLTRIVVVDNTNSSCSLTDDTYAEFYRETAGFDSRISKSQALITATKFVKMAPMY